MTSVMAVFGLVSLWGLGFLVTPWLGSFHPAARCGMAYGIGTVWVMLVMGGMGLLGLPLSLISVALAVVASAVVGWVIGRWAGFTSVPFRVTAPVGTQGRRETFWAGLGIGGIVGIGIGSALTLLTLLRAWVRPITAWDAWYVYAVKAKMIYATGMIPLNLLGTVNTPDYPLGPPLQQVWAVLLSGSWSETAIKLAVWGYFPAMGLMAYGALRERFSPGLAVFGALFVGAIPLTVQHSHEPYTDLPLAYFVLGQSVALTHFLCTHRRHGLFVAALFGVGAVLTRVDGPVFIIANALLLTVMKVSVKERLVYLGPAAAVWAAWAAVRPRAGFETALVSNLAPLAGSVDRVWPVAAAFGQSLFMSGNWMLVWTVFFVVFLLRLRSTVQAEHIFLSWPVVIYFAVLVWLFVTKESMTKFLFDHTLLHRLILHVAPLAALWVAFILCTTVSTRRSVKGAP
ncbi:MAG: hypothetical protein ACOYXR_06935 [Nitrospirota bacterium]